MRGDVNVKQVEELYIYVRKRIMNLVIEKSCTLARHDFLSKGLVLQQLQEVEAHWVLEETHVGRLLIWELVISFRIDITLPSSTSGSSDS